MAEVVSSLESLLSLHEKTNNSLQNRGKTLFGRMFDMFPIPSNVEKSGVEFRFLEAKKKKQFLLRKKLFQENGVLLSEDELRLNHGTGVGSIKHFRAKELNKGTENYAEHMIIGRGPSGNVYKGILADNRVVAIKKSIFQDVERLEEYINEIMTLAFVNHQNMVRLLGCCLETEVTLLAYEFVSNSTLYHHIHNGTGILTWDTCLRIAHESAGVLAYLHSDVRIPVIHGDMKSSNIMLDENYTAKIINFGVSRLVPLDDDHVTTVVRGTFGYVDPEYWQTSQLTHKSDVYSFGVVLVEILTRKKPVSMERCQEDRHLAAYFTNEKRENRWQELLDSQVVMEATEEQIKAACDLVSRCIDLHGVNRPSMKEVTAELLFIKEIGQKSFSR